MAAREALRELAAAVGGRPGARLAERQGAPASRDTLLRLLREESLEAVNGQRKVVLPQSR